MRADKESEYGTRSEKVGDPNLKEYIVLAQPGEQVTPGSLSQYDSKLWSFFPYLQ